MPLTQSQLVVLKADIDANPGEFGSIPNTPDGHLLIANIYNALAVPDFWVFRRSMSIDQVREAIVWSEVLAPAAKLPDTERWSFEVLVGDQFNPESVNNRTGLSQIFAGAAYTTTRTNLILAATEKATRIQKLFAVPGTGPGGGNGLLQTAAAIRVVFDPVTGSEIDAARNL